MQVVSTIFLAFILLMGSNIAEADDSTIGKIIAAKDSNIIISKNGKESIANVTEDVYNEDTIVTLPRGFVIVQFTDGTKITIRPSSKVKIEDYAFDTENDRAEVSLIEGGLRIVTGAITKRDSDKFRLNTPVALMGVRGTEFSVQLCGEEVCKENED